MSKAVIAVILIVFWITLFWLPICPHTDIDKLKLLLTHYSYSPSWTPTHDEIAYHLFSNGSYDLCFAKTQSGETNCDATEDYHEYMPLFACSGRIIVYGTSSRGDPLRSKIIAMNRVTGEKSVIADEDMFMVPVNYDAANNSVAIEKTDVKSMGLGINIITTTVLLDCTEDCLQE